MMLHCTTLNKEQADDFLKKYMQDNIKVTRIAKDDEDGIYFVDLNSGKRFNKVDTSWQFRPHITSTDKLLGSCNLGLCFGSHIVPGTNKRYDIYEHTDELLHRASTAVWKAIQKWEQVSPVDFTWNEVAYPEEEKVEVYKEDIKTPVQETNKKSDVLKKVMYWSAVAILSIGCFFLGGLLL